VDELTLEKIGSIIRNEKIEYVVKKGRWTVYDVIDIRQHENDKPSIRGLRLNRDEAKLLLQILREELE
tara:strand:- start:645 stop:848 length:204 start_codon:yes stop_codon:yes gene_type:complete